MAAQKQDIKTNNIKAKKTVNVECVEKLKRVLICVEQMQQVSPKGV